MIADRMTDDLTRTITGKGIDGSDFEETVREALRLRLVSGATPRRH